jgi:CBS domain-containing protein
MRRVEFPSERREFPRLTAGVLMERNVVTCQASDTARHVAYQLTASNFGALPVVEPRGILAGLVSEFDLLRALREGRGLDSVRAEEIMTREVATVEESTLVDDVIRLMEKKHLIRVPVVARGTLVGMLARRDILDGYLKTSVPQWPIAKQR